MKWMFTRTGVICNQLDIPPTFGKFLTFLGYSAVFTVEVLWKEAVIHFMIKSYLLCFFAALVILMDLVFNLHLSKMRLSLSLNSIGVDSSLPRVLEAFLKRIILVDIETVFEHHRLVCHRVNEF